MSRWRMWFGAWVLMGLLWMMSGGGDLRAGDADVMGMLRRLQSRFVTLDTRFLDTTRLVDAAKQQADAAKQQADAAKQQADAATQASARATEEAVQAKQQATEQAAQAKQQVDAAKQQVDAAKQQADAAKQQADASATAAQTARTEASAAKQAVAALEQRLEQQAQSIRKLSAQLEQLKNNTAPLVRKAGQSQSFAVDGVRFVGRWIPAGEFVMGSPFSEVGRDGDEGPQRRVRISRGFWMMESEVTQGLYKAVMGSDPSYFSSCGERCPVERVSWHDAALFANKLSEKQGLAKCFVCSGEGDALRCDAWGNKGSDYVGCKGWRLPTEAEWEYAARAGTEGAYHGELDKIAWYSGNSDSKTHVVGEKEANAWGLKDVHGNVWEWVYDIYQRNAYQILEKSDPAHMLNHNSWRVVRGGGWNREAQNIRSAYRHRIFSTQRMADVGFRLIRR